MNIKHFVLAGLLLAAAPAVQAQEKTTGQKIKGTGKKVGNKTAQVASKGKSKTFATRIKDKEGPNGETIYMDKENRYYWVDDKGRNQYITEAELRPRTKKD